MSQSAIRDTEKPTFPVETTDFFGGDELRVRCFVDKYALRDMDGQVVEKTPVEMWRRLAKEISSVEAGKKISEWEEKFYWLLEDFRFIPGGRIMFGAGQPRNSTLLNCYVIPVKEDSIEGIFEWCKEAARTYSYGGGVGTDISLLRPKGAPVNNSAIYSTGSVSFMDLFSLTTGTIGQSGRRGALMITISCEHPDLLDFIEVKNDPSRTKVQFANISVRLTDAFMQAVEDDKEFTLRYENDVIGEFNKTINAREVWNKLIENAHSSAEPGLIFWDSVTKESTTEYNGMNVVTTNPCSEIPLEPFGCCCLGNVNLAKFVENEFEKNAKINWGELEQTLRYGTRFLDDVLDYNADKHPLQEQKDASLSSRRIGVGFTGFGDMLAMMNFKYDSNEAIDFTDQLFERMKNIIHDESTEIAVEKGTFTAYDYEKHMQSPYIQRLDEDVKVKIKERGIRNAALITVPPVGSGSILAGTSSGIEPMFSLSYIRKSQSLSKEEFKVYHPLVGRYLEKFNLESQADLPDVFVTSHSIQPEFRVKMQATIQHHIDHAISSTVNLAKDTTVAEVDKIYMQGWKMGCKGITVYREGSREGVLITEEESNKTKTLDEAGARATKSPRPRPKIVQGRTHRMKTEMGHLYVTINADDKGMVEVFANIGKSGSSVAAYTEAIGRLISLALRSGIKPTTLVDELSLIRGLRPVLQEDGSVVFSVPDAIAKSMDEYLRGGEQLPLLDEVKPQVAIQTEDTTPPTLNGHGQKRQTELCPSCGGLLLFSNGCYICGDCGFSECD
jgi:ribonucleoside-diphosphate reductase alpha chain